MLTALAAKTVWFFVILALTGPVGDELVVPYMSPAFATRAECVTVWEKIERTAFLNVTFCIEVPATVVRREEKEAN